MNNPTPSPACDFCGSDLPPTAEYCEFCGKATFDTSRNYVELSVPSPELSQQTVVQGRIISDQGFDEWVGHITDLRRQMLAKGARAVRIDSVVWEIRPKKHYRFEIGDHPPPGEILISVYADDIIEHEVRRVGEELIISGGDFDPVTRFDLPLDRRTREELLRLYGRDILSGLEKIIDL